MSSENMVFEGIDRVLREGLSISVANEYMFVEKKSPYSMGAPVGKKIAPEHKNENKRYSSRIWSFDRGSQQQPYIHREANLGHSIGRLDSLLLRANSPIILPSLVNSFSLYKTELGKLAYLMDENPGFGIVGKAVGSGDIKTSLVEWGHDPNSLSFYGPNVKREVAGVRSGDFGEGLGMLCEGGVLGSILLNALSNGKA